LLVPSIDFVTNRVDESSQTAHLDTEEVLWRRWRESRDWNARESLLAQHLPYAKVVAASYYAKRFHDEIEFADYHQLASMGMIEAMERFDPSLGVAFRTFAARRMHGAILDGIEKLSEKQQQIVARHRLEAQRRESIKSIPSDDEQCQGESATPADSPDGVLKYVAEVGMAFALAWVLDGTGMIGGDEAAVTLPFYQSAEMRQLRERVLHLVQVLPAQERKVIHCHYLQEVSFQEIAKMLGVSKGRVSQIHRKALTHLKKVLLRHCDVSL
jgi:RNA polymerase sigma factor for flagellar operon FliA